MREGDVYTTNNYGDLKVLKYIDSSNVLVEFINTGYQIMARATSIRNSAVKDRLYPYILGVGYMGIGEYGSRHKAYSVWRPMIYRCYSLNSLCRHPTYKGCSVSEDWHNFQNFAKWFEHNYKDGYELDKDLIVVGNKVYSQETCIFVPPKINLFIIDSTASRGEYPIGVYYNKRIKKYVANCRNGRGLQSNLGCFTDPIQANLAWRDYKLMVANEMRPEMDAIDERIYHNVVTMINNSK